MSTDSDLWDCDRSLESLGIDVPAWIDTDPETSITVSDVMAIRQGGCASGAWMPAVTYSDALDTMRHHGDDVLQYVEDALGELPKPDDNTSWSGMACHYLSCAVELWCGALDEDELLGLIEPEPEDEPEPDDAEPDMMAPNDAERSEMQYRAQRDK